MMATLVDARRQLAGARPEVRTALVLSVLLLLYGNGNAVFSTGTREQFLLWSNLGLLVLLLAWAFGAARFSAAELGLAPRTAPASAALGGALSIAAALPPVLFIALAPLFAGGPVESDVTGYSGAGMAYFLAFRQPVGTALFEEVAFRGVLYGAWQRAGGDRLALIATALAFAAWHLVITSRTVAASGVVDAPWAVAAGVAVSLAGLFIGGLLFAYLRWHTNSVAAPAMAHWLIVALMSAAVWAVG
jgi:membrane protease YdiL (CAAX protease family)